MSDYSVELVNDQTRLARLIERIAFAPVIALDIETVNWWNRHQEQIALIQIAFRSGQQPKVAIIDTLAKLDVAPLRAPLEQNTVTKVIHNAAFDATRLNDHFRFKVAPIYDTMVAARRGGEKRYSLKAQAASHLNLHLDKSGQQSDWSRRPLRTIQIHYAALDAVAALLLYENQISRKLNGSFQLKEKKLSPQATLPLIDLQETNILSNRRDGEHAGEEKSFAVQTDLPPARLALLGIIVELPSRYHPDQLSVSVGNERVGLAGWIVDRILGRDADLDETTAKLEIAGLCEHNLVKITATRRLEATEKGAQIWSRSKSL
ncbi:MAG TPA: hypothetical protein VF556_02045 [Pyrinomonadaceae bacterium]|jgi:hypothetical protein